MGKNHYHHWYEDEVLANEMRTHYYRTGGEKPHLVLLHGFSENGLCWSRVAKALEGEYDVMMPDARGHGLSSGPETRYAQDLLTADVASMMHEFGVAHPLVWGYSNGAVTAAHLAATHPHLVQAVVLEDPPWHETTMQAAMASRGAGGGEPWAGYQAWYASWLAWHRALGTQTPAERMAASRPFLPPGAFAWPEEELLSHLEAQAQFNLGVFNFIPPLPVPTSWRGTVERIACSVLLLTSDPQRGVAVTEKEVQAIAAAWRKGQQVSFPQASHFLHHEMQGEQFAHFIAVADAFLKDAQIVGEPTR